MFNIYRAFQYAFAIQKPTQSANTTGQMQEMSGLESDAFKSSFVLITGKLNKLCCSNRCTTVLLVAQRSRGERDNRNSTLHFLGHRFSITDTCQSFIFRFVRNLGYIFCWTYVALPNNL